MNKNTLNAQRLLQYFCKDWSENAAQLYYYFIIPYGIMTLLFIWMDFTKTHSVEGAERDGRDRDEKREDDGGKEARSVARIGEDFRVE